MKHIESGKYIPHQDNLKRLLATLEFSSNEASAITRLVVALRTYSVHLREKVMNDMLLIFDILCVPGLLDLFGDI